MNWREGWWGGGVTISPRDDQAAGVKAFSIAESKTVGVLRCRGTIDCIVRLDLNEF